jgi:hypothetical protein
MTGVSDQTSAQTAKLRLAKDVNDFALKDMLMRALVGGVFVAQQPNVLLAASPVL